MGQLVVTTTKITIVDSNYHQNHHRRKSHMVFVITYFVSTSKS